ncbi:MAG TPA: serine/threonine-protein kinase [Phycisphaerae bacterium]|nr:serine/threonine-protein kinase [Phycisphaerae bacterium]
MCSERWKRIDELFGDARELAPDARDAFLKNRCGGDTDLLLRTRRLLRDHDRAGPQFLERPPTVEGLRGLATAKGSDPLVGQTIGSYTIRETIARGGMGRVYLAEQASPRRPVALKVMQSSAWSASAERRFDVESRVLAYLRHPNIAQVYESGAHRLEAGATVHYFAMEYIPNVRTITQHANENEHGIRDRLDLFLQLCDAVHHGHQKGIIHRDLKPANILVGSETPASTPPQASSPKSQAFLKIIDFGIARCTDSDIAVTTMHTEAGQLLGTLAYMSPEQCAADPSQIDTTTDIYSLGVILYELLTGRMPYDVSNMTIHSAARVICEKEPTRPSNFDRRLRGDVETIVLKAIEKDRAKRYASASDMAGDIRQYLRGEPISARPPTPYSLMLRWAAGHPKKSIALASLAIASLIVGSAFFSLWIVNGQPARLEFTRLGRTRDEPSGRLVRTGDQATLYSLGGRVLKPWKTADPGSITFANLANRPARWGGGKVVVLGFGRFADSPHRGELCLFDANGPYDEPLWHRTVEQESIDAMPHDAWPRPRFDSGRKYSSGGFAVHYAWMFDVFPGDAHPGEEIVAYYMHTPGSQGVLRIYNLNGDLLFQAWQDGGIEEAYWMAKAGLLVFAAIKGDMDDKEYGLRLASNHPRVIFAIRPTPRDISNKWIHPHNPGERPRFAGDEWRGERYQPAWYKMPCPVIFAEQEPFVCVFPERSNVPSPYDPDQYLELRMNSDSLGLSNRKLFSFSVILNQHGEIVERLTLSDGVRRAIAEKPELPDPVTFDLVDWKTPEFPCVTATTQPAILQDH